MSASKLRALFVLTSHSKLGNTGRSTGWYLPEFAHPYNEVSKVADITIASPAGGEAPVDHGSVASWTAKDEVCEAFWNNNFALWTNTQKLSSFVGQSKNFAALFYVGGHGPMWDLAVDESSLALIREFYENGKIVSAICHGSAALVNAKLSDGSYLVADTPVTGFSDAEEDAMELSEYMPFMLETELQKASNGKFEKADKLWGEKVVVSKGGRLITGQNPFSAKKLASELARAIQTRGSEKDEL